METPSVRLSRNFYSSSTSTACPTKASASAGSTIPTSSTSLARSSSSTSSHTSAPTSAIGASGWATSSSCCWPRAYGWLTTAAGCAPGTSSGSPSTPRCSPSTSPSRPPPSSCTRPSRGSTAWRVDMGRQSYLRLAKRAAMMAGRYAHAKQFNRHQRELRFLRTRLGRLIRDIRRKVRGRDDLEAAFQEPLSRASQIRSQQQRQRGWKLYSFHAPEVECIGKGKARSPYEFGVKVSIVATNRCAPAGQFVLHAQSLPGNPYDGHTLNDAIEGAQRLTGLQIVRAYVDKGYRGHDAPNPRRVFISGQKRGVFGVIKRELRRRSAIEPLIGHMKEEGHLGRCFLKGHAGDAANAILTAVGHNC